MQDEIVLSMDEDGLWGIKEEPFITVECPTEEDYKKLVEAVEKQKAKQVEVHVDNVLTKYSCPNCGRLYWEKLHITNCCDMCGQRLMV